MLYTLRGCAQRIQNTWQLTTSPRLHFQRCRFELWFNWGICPFPSFFQEVNPQLALCDIHHWTLSSKMLANARPNTSYAHGLYNHLTHMYMHRSNNFAWSKNQINTPNNDLEFWSGCTDFSLDLLVLLSRFYFYKRLDWVFSLLKCYNNCLHKGWVSVAKLCFSSWVLLSSVHLKCCRNVVTHWVPLL